MNPSPTVVAPVPAPATVQAGGTSPMAPRVGVPLPPSVGQGAPPAPTAVRLPVAVGQDAPSTPPAVRLPVNVTAKFKLDMMGIEVICGWIMAGDRQLDIARRLGVDQSDVGAWLMNHPDRDLYRAAQEASAEALMDKGDEIMETASADREITNAQVALVRARAEFYKSRAAMRSRHHRERQPIDDTSPVTAMPTFIIMPIAASQGRPAGVVIEQVPEVVR